MEILKIAGGLAVIAVLVVVFGMGDSPSRSAGASGPADRSFVSEDTSARFVPVATE